MKIFSILSFLILLIFSSTLRAQSGYSFGYIVSIKGDTIQGLVKDRDPGPFGNLFSKIKFKAEGQKRTQKYGSSEILGYSYEGVIFRSVRFREETSMFRVRYFSDLNSPRVFLRVVMESDHLIYYEREFMYDDNNVADFFPLLYIPGLREMVRVTQGIFGFKTDRLAQYFESCPKLVETLRNETLDTPGAVFQSYHEYCIQD